MQFFSNIITGAIGALLWLIVAASAFAFFGPPIEGTGDAYANVFLNLGWMSAVGTLIVATSSYLQGPRGMGGWRLFGICLAGTIGGILGFALLLSGVLYFSDQTPRAGQMVIIGFLPALILLPAIGAAATKHWALSKAVR